jgi:glyoxylate reductase
LKPKVYVTRLLPKEAMDRIYLNCDATVWTAELPPPRDVLLKNVADVEGLLSLLTDKVDSELMDAAPKLKVVSNYAVGFDNIDVAEATKRRIVVGNTPGVLTETTADLAFALILAAGRRVAEGDRFVRSGKWKTWGPMLLLGEDIHGSTLGIVGLGRIGAAVARRAKGFNMKVIYFDVVRQTQLEHELGVEYASLDALLTTSDFVTIHANLTPETYQLIGANQFDKMKKTAVIVNTARGPLIDNIALYEALRDGKIKYAGLDVTEPEPLPPDHPLLTLDNLVIVPHIASASTVTRTKMALIAVDNLLAGVNGKLGPAPVNPEVLRN